MAKSGRLFETGRKREWGMERMGEAVCIRHWRLATGKPPDRNAAIKNIIIGTKHYTTVNQYVIIFSLIKSSKIEKNVQIADHSPWTHRGR